MLPTTGYFKDIECPYYDNSCDRPYCHFRHRKRSQERADDQETPSPVCETPTYKPTPKSQLANTKSHIPISYVPDLIIRADRNFRIPSTYNYAEKPTYKPTPLSELSKSNRLHTTGKEKNIIKSDVKDSAHTYSVSSSKSEVDVDCPSHDDQNIDFEDLSKEFDMIDEIINDCNVAETLDVNDKTDTKEQTQNNVGASSSRSHTSKHDKSSRHSSRKDKKGTKPGRSESKPKKSDHKHDKINSDNKESDKSRHRHEHKKEHKSDRNKKLDEKGKSKTRSDVKHEKHRNTSSSKSKHRDKEKHKEKHKHTNDKHVDKIKKHKKSEKTEHNKDDEFKFKQENKYEIKQEPSDNEIPDIAAYSDDDSDDLNDPSLEEECYKIFNEYKPEPVVPPSTIQKSTQVVEEYVPTPKKRIAYDNADQCPSKLTFTKPKAVLSAAHMMANRIKLARLTQANNDQQNMNVESNKTGVKRPAMYDGHEETNKLLKTLSGYNFTSKKPQINHKEIKSNPLLTKSVKQPIVQNISLVDDIIGGKTKPRRIAPVQNVNFMQQAKARIEDIARKKAVAVINKTPIQTSGKGTKRVAHIPDMSLTDIPDVLQPESKKIPINIRTRYLTMFADECAKLYLIKEDAYERALNEELKVLERCAAITTYRNSAMLAINRIRKEMQERESQGLGPIASDETTNDDSDSQYKGSKFYHNVLCYILSEEELELHGYPREGPIPGRAVISIQKQMPKVNLDDSQRLCCRCFKVYLVDEIGIPLYEEDCLYHPLKKRTLRGERIYLCCKSTEDTGCVTSTTHVSETEEGDLEGFQTTMEPDRENDPRNCAVYALDCEMCYTTKGLELTRVTIIDADCKTVYESFVKPLNPIIDYNTRFSGITKEQMDKTSTSILQVQANILHLCNSKTILIGHSLESDMKALKIIHSSIIDTAVMYPHRLGLPHKRALRVLASEYLRKIIQSDVGGHDSAEDALTCMELVQWKVKEDLKVRGIK